MIVCLSVQAKRKDINILASEIIEKAIDESSIKKNLAAVTLGRLGGLKGVKLGLRNCHQNNEKK